MSGLNRKPWIQNVSMKAIMEGHHFFEPHRTVLIQIQDPDSKFFVPPKHEFKQVTQILFDDAEDGDEGLLIEEDDAQLIASVLRQALFNGDNVVVHCHAGLCRSGAVAECGVMLGFDDTNMERIPNRRVKRMLRKALNLTQSWED